MTTSSPFNFLVLAPKNSRTNTSCNINLNLNLEAFVAESLEDTIFLIIKDIESCKKYCFVELRMRGGSMRKHSEKAGRTKIVIIEECLQYYFRASIMEIVVRSILYFHVSTGGQAAGSVKYRFASVHTPDLPPLPVVPSPIMNYETSATFMTIMLVIAVQALTSATQKRNLSTELLSHCTLPHVNWSILVILV